jgi:hypothetical protein
MYCINKVKFAISWSLWKRLKGHLDYSFSPVQSSTSLPVTKVMAVRSSPGPKIPVPGPPVPPCIGVRVAVAIAVARVDLLNMRLLAEMPDDAPVNQCNVLGFRNRFVRIEFGKDGLLL